MGESAAPRKHPHGSASALLRATRPGNVALAALGTTAGALAGGAPIAAPPHVVALLAAAAVGAFGTAAGNLLNDLSDIELDKNAHPERPLPSGRLSSTTAWVALVVLFLLAVAIAFAFHPLAGLLAIVLILLLILYETRWKAQGLPGNLLIAIAAGTLFPLGALIAHADIRPPLILGGLAALAHLGRELLKDAQDAQADAPHRRTLAITHGPHITRRAAAAALIAAVLLSPLPLAALDWPPLYLLLVTPAVILLLVSAMTGFHDPRRAQSLAKAAMALALLAFLITARI
jgi:geranylgeranylglycerol-phosphate geranylgeranyltransferase